MNEKNIYQKIFTIQQAMEKLTRKRLNKAQNYRYFTECDILMELRPLLKEQNLLLLISDKEEEFIHEKTEKGQHLVRYLKKLEIVDVEKPESRITYHF